MDKRDPEAIDFGTLSKVISGDMYDISCDFIQKLVMWRATIIHSFKGVAGVSLEDHGSIHSLKLT